MLATPFPIVRIPHICTPAIYAGFVTWSVMLSNPAMVAFAFFVDDRISADLTFASVGIILGALTAGTVLSGALVMATMVPSYRNSFYKHYTLKTHLREYAWFEATAVNARGQVLIGCGHER